MSAPAFQLTTMTATRECLDDMLVAYGLVTTTSDEPRSVAPWPESDLEHLGQCPVCGDPGRTPIHEGLVDRLGSPGAWTLYRCASCGSGYIDPRPTVATIGRLYVDYYTHETPNCSVSPMGRLRDLLFHGYLAERFGYSFAPSSHLGRIAVTLIPGGAGMASRRVRHLTRPRGDARLLDVGFGAGEFLRRMKGSGWSVEGIDPDPKAVEQARQDGLEVRVGTLDSDAVPNDRYDAITLSHSIEHVHDPPAVLRASFAALRPGGVLWIATPNLAARGHHDFGRYWAALDPPRHLVLFTRSALAAALRRAGFERLSAPPTTLEAFGWTYRASEAISRGADPMRPPPLSPRLYPRAILADLLTLARRSFEEELAVVAWKPRP